ncbi:hypothetical protein OS493_027776 [Desmophyllum pertusum]|nr:hypothetical protein OS493_027776 [Desmophyllum pertusum]
MASVSDISFLMGNTITSMFPTTTETYMAHAVTTESPERNVSNGTSPTMNSSTVYHAPTFALIILVPLIPLILFSYIRSVRKLGPVSFAANVALLVAFVSVVGYMLSGLKFKLKEIKLSNWATFPVFFGQVASAYEGIGTLIPIETSMAENRHRFPMYLHFAVGTLSVILGCFGLLGYLVYGEGVNQIVTESFPSGLLIQIVRCLLCFAILLTYPLQIFPVIEIIEGWLFNSECNTVENSNDDDESSSEGVDDVSCQNMSQTAILGSASESSRLLAPEIPKQKSMARKWKKNLLRTFLVLTTAGIAIALKDDFAYVSALVGSLGSATLGFILPCIFHLVLCKDSNTTLTKVKDYLFIAFGIVGGVIGVTVTIMQIVEQFTKS